jgi:hypothetical protein
MLSLASSWKIENQIMREFYPLLEIELFKLLGDTATPIVYRSYNSPWMRADKNM